MTASNVTAGRVADPITTQIAWSRLVGLADEAAVMLAKTSFSLIVRESHDFSCVLLNRAGDVVAQENLSYPIFVHSTQQALKAILAEVPADAWRPGDAYWTNDPWIGSGDIHDLHVLAPIFRDGELIAFAGTVAHWPDVGGRQWSATAREVYEEGLRFPPTKLMTNGVVDPIIVRLLEANVRVPREALGDLRAQIVANETMTAGLHRLLDEGLIEDFDAFAADLMDRSEQAMRNGIEAFPDGTYHYEVELDGFDESLVLAATVTVEASEVVVDFTGSSPQTDRAVNSVLNYTVGAATLGIRAMFDATTPNNAGTFRPVTFIVPQGTILNAAPPVGTGARHLTGHFTAMAVLGALSQGDVDKGVAEYSNLWQVILGGTSAGAPWVAAILASSGVGARAHADGWSCRMMPHNAAGTSVEMLEQVTPLLIRRKMFSAGSGGRGAHRGGLGQELEVEHMGTGIATLTVMTEKVSHPARGAAGGEPGRAGTVEIDGAAVHAKGRFELRPGQVVSIRTSGGGGYGPATERAPELTARDELDGLV